MGNCCRCCCPSEWEKHNALIDQKLKQDEKDFNKVKRMLFLGSGGSGKSTIFKQLRGIYGTGFNHQERKLFVQYIHEQVITQMKNALVVYELYRNGDSNGILHQNALKYMDKKTIDMKHDDIEYDSDYSEQDFHRIMPELSESGKEAQIFLTNCNSYRLNDGIVSAIKCLWSEPAIQKIYEMRNITKIDDSSAYFWDGLDQLNTPNYVPDTADILLVRYRTTGTTEETYTVSDEKGQNSFPLTIIDVGGQRSERKKWLHQFESVTAVIFVASLSCYDEVLYEDYSTNSMTDQLELFDNICNYKALRKTSMILFLNKKDLFAEKIKHVPLKKCPSFIDYNGPKDSYEQTTQYIRKAFVSLNNVGTKNVFTHITCATDQDNIQTVFRDVQHTIIENSLIEAGLMDGLDSNTNVDNKNRIQGDMQTAQTIRKSIRHCNQTKKSYRYLDGEVEPMLSNY